MSEHPWGPPDRDDVRALKGEVARLWEQRATLIRNAAKANDAKVILRDALVAIEGGHEHATEDEAVECWVCHTAREALDRAATPT